MSVRRLWVAMYALSFAACALVLSPPGVWGQESYDESLSVLVSPFASTDPMAGTFITELIRNGLSSAPFLLVLEEGNSSYILEGSVEQAESELHVSYRLFDRVLGRVELAGSAVIRADTMQQDGAAVAAAVNNVLLSSYAGSTISAIEELMRARRYDEARRRLDSLAVRSSGDAQIEELANSIARGLSLAWKQKAIEELKEASTKKGEDAMRLALQARNSLESALLLLPKDSSDDVQRDSIARTLTGPVNAVVERCRKETVGDYTRRMKAELRSGNPAAAILLYEDFVSLYGESNTRPELIDVRARAATVRASELALHSRNALSKGEYWLALSMAGQALDIEGKNTKARLAFENASLVIEKVRAQEEAELYDSFGGPPHFRASWGYTASVGLWGADGRDLTFPVQGLIPVVSLGMQRVITAGDSLLLSLGTRLSYGAGQNTVYLYGATGNTDLSLLALGIVVELAGLWSIPGMFIRPGIVGELGAQYYRWSADYDSGSSVPGKVLAPAVALGVALGIVPDKALELRLMVCGTGRLVADYGAAAGLRLSLEARYLM